MSDNLMNNTNTSVDNVTVTPDITVSNSNRSRSSSVLKEARSHSYSISSVKSDEDDSSINPYANRNRKLSEYDLENQLILTAGGSKEDVYCFLFKLLILMALVFGSGVLIFYAL